MVDQPARSAPGARAGARRPRRMAPERRRDHLIATALQLYSRRSPQEVSVDDIVEEADVSRALFYRYFTNIRDLHVTALTKVVDELLVELTLPSSGDPRRDLHTALERFLEFAETYAASYTALLRSGSTIATSNTSTLVERVRKHVVDQLREHLGLNEAPRALERTLRGWVAVVETTLLFWLEDRDMSKEQLEAWLADQLFAMVATTAQHDPASARHLSSLLGPPTA